MSETVRTLSTLGAGASDNTYKYKTVTVLPGSTWFRAKGGKETHGSMSQKGREIGLDEENRGSGKEKFSSLNLVAEYEIIQYNTILKLKLMN